MSAASPLADDRGAVLVMDGMTGIGWAIALTFARHGARLVLSGKCGPNDRAGMARRLAELGAPEPLFTDDQHSGDTGALFSVIGARCGPIRALIGRGRPASTGAKIGSIGDYDKGEFIATLGASAWPLVEHTLAAKRYLGAYPRYVVALVSEPPDRFAPGHDFTACAEAVTETLVRYLAYRLRDEEVRVNAVRSRAVRMKAEGAAVEIGGRKSYPVASPAQDVANAVLALCSGMFDGMSGQVLTVDRGDSFIDGISIVYENELLGR